jgi:hypothetical protein
MLSTKQKGMTPLESIRVWRDEADRLSLSEAEWVQLSGKTAELAHLVAQLTICSGALATPFPWRGASGTVGGPLWLTPAAVAGAGGTS